MKTIKIDGLSDLPEAVQKLITEINARQANVIAFYGEMGAGKTTLIKEICHQMGIDPGEVNSPSFSIVNVYSTKLAECECGKTTSGSAHRTVNHFDFYRIRSIEEAYDFGYEEYFFGGDLCLVEWPEKIDGLLPDDALIVRLKVVDEDTRILEIETP